MQFRLISRRSEKGGVYLNGAGHSNQTHKKVQNNRLNSYLGLDGNYISYDDRIERRTLVIFGFSFLSICGFPLFLNESRNVIPL